MQRRRAVRRCSLWCTLVGLRTVWSVLCVALWRLVFVVNFEWFTARLIDPDLEDLGASPYSDF